VARELVIDFEWHSGDRRIPEMRNFGEDLHGACKEDGWATISLDEIDRATDRLRVSMFSARRVRRIAALISKLLDRHFLTTYAKVSEVAPST
jgi:hypothetical protein